MVHITVPLTMHIPDMCENWRDVYKLKTLGKYHNCSRGEWGTFCHFSQIDSGAHTSNSWCSILSRYIPYTKSLKCPVCVSVASQLVLTLDSVMSMRHLTEPAPYTGQALPPAWAHSVSEGHILLSPHAIQCPWIVSFQFVPLILVNYNK